MRRGPGSIDAARVAGRRHAATGADEARRRTTHRRVLAVALPLALTVPLAFASPLVGCSAWGGAALPTDTVWRVVEIDGAPVPRLDDNRAPTLLLDSTDARASGYSGCNRFTGSYTIGDDEAIAFSPLASTRMACDATSMEVELGYLSSLGATTRWRRRSDGFELLDELDAVRVRFEKTGRIDAPLDP